ncbi:MAG TPA: hypothetical protein VFC51_16445 [Chloroflexota bacterium]|nr:hypothetical protein [Chloroflexota bacterium]
MPTVGDQADVLRALGRLLDQEQAQAIEITNHDVFVSVTWQRRGGTAEQRALQEIDLETLRADARAMRKGIFTRNPGGSLAELLRTLGQELDRAQVDVSTITEEPEGFRVSGVAGGRYFRQLYHKSDLLSLSASRRAMRHGWQQGPRYSARG